MTTALEARTAAMLRLKCLQCCMIDDDGGAKVDRTVQCEWCGEVSCCANIFRHHASGCMTGYETYRHPGDPGVRRQLVDCHFPAGVAGLIEQYTRPVNIKIRRSAPHCRVRFIWHGRITEGSEYDGCTIRPILEHGITYEVRDPPRRPYASFRNTRSLVDSFCGDGVASLQSIADKNATRVARSPVDDPTNSRVWWLSTWGQREVHIGVNQASVAMFQEEISDLERIWDHLSKDRTTTLDVPRCAHCGTMIKKLLRCSRCRCVLYCGKDHQVAHWKEKHQSDCRR